MSYQLRSYTELFALVRAAGWRWETRTRVEPTINTDDHIGNTVKTIEKIDDVLADAPPYPWLGAPSAEGGWR